MSERLEAVVDTTGRSWGRKKGRSYISGMVVDHRPPAAQYIVLSIVSSREDDMVRIWNLGQNIAIVSRVRRLNFRLTGLGCSMAPPPAMTCATGGGKGPVLPRVWALPSSIIAAASSRLRLLPPCPSESCSDADEDDTECVSSEEENDDLLAICCDPRSAC